MKNELLFIILLSLFLIFISMMGTISAANWTVNPGDSIQSVINNASSNDTIIVNDNYGSGYTYTENVVVNKTVQLKVNNGGNVTIQALNSSQPIFTVNAFGNSTKIQNFKITGATDSSGIYLDGTSNCIIYGNSLTGNQYGLYILNGKNNFLSGNIVINNEYGIYLYNSSANVEFNRIVGNSKYGLYTGGNETAHATNNWWGTNNPVISSNSGSDIYIAGGTVTYNPWLVLTVSPTSYKVSGGKTYEATITADLNHNSNGGYLSTLIHVPDGIPVNFASNNGSAVTSTGYTVKGEASATLVLNPNLQSGLTNVNATVDGQSNSTLVDRIAKAVITISSSAVDVDSIHLELDLNKFNELNWWLVFDYGITIYEYGYMYFGDYYAYENPNLMPEVWTYHYSPLNLTYEVPLNESVSWVSVLWKNTGLFLEEVDIVVNGNVVLNKTVLNTNYFQYKNSFSQNVFGNINFLNWLFSNTPCAMLELNNIIAVNPQLQNLTGNGLEEAMLARAKQVNNFTDSEINFIRNRQDFKDTLTMHIFYPGDAAKTITINDPDTNENLDLYFRGNPIVRVSDIIYADGFYTYQTGIDQNNVTQYKAEPAGYEGVRSFAIATTKVTDGILQYWLDQKDRTNVNGTLLYPEGPMKAAYGTFLNALLVIKCHDMVADAAASKFNVTWARTTPIAVSTLDDAYNTLLTGEMSHRMGMDVTGDPDNVRAFRFACSSSFSPIEYWVMASLFPNQDQNGTIIGPNPLGSVTLGLGDMILNGEQVDIFMSNGYIVIKAVGSNGKILLIDPETGLVMDLLTGNETSCGSYCYKNQQAEWGNDLGEQLLNNLPSWLGFIGGFSMSGASAFTIDFGTSELAAVLGSNPVGWVIGLAAVFGAVDGYLIATYPDEAVPANLEAIPFVGTFLSVYSLQSVLQGNGDPLTPGNLAVSCHKGANLLLVLSEDEDFDNIVTELEGLYNTGKYDDIKQSNKLVKKYKEGKDKLDGLGNGGDDPDKWRKMLDEAVKNKKWVAATLIVGAGLLNAFSNFLDSLENHK